MTLAIFWPISPSCPCSNKEIHYEGYMSRHYHWFAARGRLAEQIYSSLHLLRSVSWHTDVLIKSGLNERPISSHLNIYSNSKPVKKSKYGHTGWTQSSTDQQTTVKDTQTRVVLPVQKRNISLTADMYSILSTQLNLKSFYIFQKKNAEVLFFFFNK